jgi:hypothetical protein
MTHLRELYPALPQIRGAATIREALILPCLTSRQETEP